MTSLIRSIGALIAVLRASANAAATAGGTGDATKTTGVIIDRHAIGTPLSAVLAIPFTATLAADKTLSIAWEIESGEASNLAGGAVLKSGTSVVATGPSGGGTVTGCLEVPIDLSGAGRYIRANFTPDLSATGTDTAALSSVLVVGGMDRLPQ